MWHKVMMVLVVYVLMAAALVVKCVDADVSVQVISKLETYFS